MRDRPLDGFAVGVTADRRADEQGELLTRLGATVRRAPVIRTFPLAPDDRLRAITADIIDRPPDYLIANTGIGMRGWFSAADSWGLEERLVAALRGSRVACRGPKAAGVVGAAGLPMWWRAPGEELREVVDHLLARGVDGCRVVVQLDGDHGSAGADRLLAAGADVIGVPVYRWTLPEDDRPAQRLIEAAAEGDVHAITFTAAPAVRNLFELAARSGAHGALLKAFNEDGVVAACVGPVCARAATAAGITSPVQPRVARLGGLVRTVADVLGGTACHVVIAGLPVVVRGAAVEVAGHRVTLSSQDRALLGALTGRPGSVVAHDRLLRAMNATDGSRHTLAVAVSRLRARLGPAGAGVRAVPRRGYRLDPER